MLQAAEKRNIELPSNARQIKKEDLDKFDLVVVMDNSNFKNVYPMASTELQKKKLESLLNLPPKAVSILFRTHILVVKKALKRCLIRD